MLAQENEERRKLTEAQALAGELRTLTVPVSYAKAADLVPVITRSTLSARGDVQVDARTNTLIIRDLADRLTAAAELVRTLDRPQPQVEIEARIVQLNRNSARALGIQWGFNGESIRQLGTSTGLAFPSSGGLTARRPAASDPGNSVGHRPGARLDQRRAQPRRQPARARNRRQRPHPGDAARRDAEQRRSGNHAGLADSDSGRSRTTPSRCTFKDAALTLRVTPQITAANTVIMRIFVEKAAPNYTQTTAAQPVPSIDTQRAVTSVLMDDGETTVIGGIYTREEVEVNDRTPFLHRLPLLGWLFKTESTARRQRRTSDLHHSADREVGHMSTRHSFVDNRAGAGCRRAAWRSSASCGSEMLRTGRSPVFLVVTNTGGGPPATAARRRQFLLSDVQVLVDQTVNGVTAQVPTFYNDIATAEFRVEAKNPDGSDDGAQRGHAHALSRGVSPHRWTQYAGCRRAVWVRRRADARRSAPVAPARCPSTSSGIRRSSNRH